MLPYRDFYFIRHGQTIWNSLHLITGQANIPLNEVGISQAFSQKSLLPPLKISHIFVSPLERALHTAIILNKELQKPLITKKGLRERAWGEWEGTPHTKSLSDLTPSQLPPNAETFGDFGKRIINTMKLILHPDHELPLIVAHAGVFLVLAKALGHPALRSPNCTLFKFKALKKEKSWDITPLQAPETNSHSSMRNSL